MKKPPHKQSDAHPADSDSSSDSLGGYYLDSDLSSRSGDFDDNFYTEAAPAPTGRLVAIFLMGFLAAILLSTLAYFLVIKPQGQNAGAPTASSPDQTIPEGGLLVDATGLNLEAQHPDGTVLRIEGISFNAKSTIVQLTVINTRNPGDGLIRLNQSWGNTPNTMILRDEFGGEYPLIATGGNSDFEVKPGQTITGEFSFRGKMNPATRTVTLVTNSEGGSPTHSISQTPLIEVKISVNRTNP